MLPTSPADLDRFLREQEGPNLECKTAETGFDSRKLRKYLCALSNAGGGHLILGVTDAPPREVVGSAAFPNVYADLNQIRQDLEPSPHLDARVVEHSEGRVLVFEAGPRPGGQVIRYQRTPWSRLGESLVAMRDEELRRILLEGYDATDDVCDGATLDDLDRRALHLFQAGVVQKARDAETAARYAAMQPSELLRAAGLLTKDGQLRKAGVILLGTEEAVNEWTPNSEVVFEYRSVPTAIPYDDRLPVRSAALLALEEIWSSIQPYARLRPIEYQRGTQVVREPRFPERSVREALLNAIAHRDYNDPESVHVRMTPDEFEVTSPGPFPATVTPENVADEQFRRNRRLAEALEKCGRIERSGQGVDLMIQEAVQLAEPTPTFDEPDGRSVRVVLHGTVDEAAHGVLRNVPNETWTKLSASGLLALDAVRRRAPRSTIPQGAVGRLVELGLVEPGGTGDSPLVYARALTDAPGTPPSPTIADVIDILRDAQEGLRFIDIRERLELPNDELRRSLQWLRRNGLAYTTGRTRATRWHYGRETPSR